MRVSSMVSEQTNLRTVGESRFILVNIHHMVWPVTTEILYQVFDYYGYVEDIVISRESQCALIQFDTCSSAVFVKESLNGRNIFDGCCRMDIKFCDYYGNTTYLATGATPYRLEPQQPILPSYQLQPCTDVAIPQPPHHHDYQTLTLTQPQPQSRPEPRPDNAPLPYHQPNNQTHTVHPPQPKHGNYTTTKTTAATPPSQYQPEPLPYELEPVPQPQPIDPITTKKIIITNKQLPLGVRDESDSDSDDWFKITTAQPLLVVSPETAGGGELLLAEPPPPPWPGELEAKEEEKRERSEKEIGERVVGVEIRREIVVWGLSWANDIDIYLWFTRVCREDSVGDFEILSWSSWFGRVPKVRKDSVFSGWRSLSGISPHRGRVRSRVWRSVFGLPRTVVDKMRPRLVLQSSSFATTLRSRSFSRGME